MVKETKIMVGSELNEDSLFEHFAFHVDRGQEPLRVDKFLMNRIENTTRNKIQQAVKSGAIIVNENVVKSNYKIKGGDLVKVLFSHPPSENLFFSNTCVLTSINNDHRVLIKKEYPYKMFSCYLNDEVQASFCPFEENI